MSLTIRKAIVLGLIGPVVLLGNILFVANWLAEAATALNAEARWLDKLGVSRCNAGWNRSNAVSDPVV